MKQKSMLSPSLIAKQTFHSFLLNQCLFQCTTWQVKNWEVKTSPTYEQVCSSAHGPDVVQWFSLEG